MISTAALQSKASRQWGKWLGSRNWHLRITMTFSPSKLSTVSHELALGRARDGMNWLGGHIHSPIAWIAFTEFTARGHAHVHIDARFTDDRRPSSDQMRNWERWLRRRNGFVRVQDYVKGLGGARYDSKYAGSSETQWDCSNAFLKLMRNQGGGLRS